MMNTSTRWLVWSTQEPDERLQVRVDSDVTWATWRVGGGDAVLWGLIRLHPGWPLARWHVGRWAPAAGLQYDNRRLQWVAKKNLQGLALGAALPIVDTPLDNLGERLKNVNDRQLDTMARFGWGLSTTLARLLNFSIILYRVRNFGSLVSENEMDGAVALIHNGTVEFGAAGFIMTTRRMDFMDYTGPGRLWAPEIMFRHPKSASVLTTIFKPYTAELWVSSGALFVLILVVSRLFCWVEHRVTATVDEIDNSWNSTFLLVSSAIGQQGVSRSSEWLSWRVLLFVSFLCTNLLDTHYAAGIVSSLLMPPPRTINNKKDLADSPLGFGLENVSYTYQFFVKSDDPVDRALCSRKLYPPGGRPNFFPAEVGVRKMATELFAFHAEDVRVGPLIDRFFSDDDKCALVFIPLLTPVATYTAVRRNSPVKELFNFGLRMMWERGHISYLRKAWYFTRVRCLSETEYASVDLVPMSPAFMLLGCAIFLSGLLLLLEVRQYRRRATDIAAAAAAAVDAGGDLRYGPGGRVRPQEEAPAAATEAAVSELASRGAGGEVLGRGLQHGSRAKDCS
ncbi:glutamate receptor ionotropic, delta-1-like [Schistocerca nitens]|uniref:glutamate receptor ionotropic, delta-1-like n=1 Tax=Schistocerca nitens TaxID=7011 RepID=UPI002119B4E0|nr:glutamate receptor ionotropic, delta-1-like [Schistocerca nitens]